MTDYGVNEYKIVRYRDFADLRDLTYGVQASGYVNLINSVSGIINFVGTSGISVVNNGDGTFDIGYEPGGGAGVTSMCQACKQGGLSKGQRCGDQTLVDFPECHFPVEYTRLNSCPPRGQSINRFNPLCLDPQKNIFFPGAYQIPTRLVMKDNHRPCVPIPAVNSMAPPPRAMPCGKIEPVCSMFSDALYQYDVCG